MAALLNVLDHKWPQVICQCRYHECRYSHHQNPGTVGVENPRYSLSFIRASKGCISVLLKVTVYVLCDVSSS